MMTVVIFLVILTVLVLVHEFGHFITARKFGMRVYEFGIGFPPRAIGIYKDPVTGKWHLVKGSKKSGLKETVGGDERVEEYPATVYSLNWLPLGGFCKIKGESGEKAFEADSFAAHKAWKRIIVLVAGVAMNVLFAAVILSVGFMVGLPTDVAGVNDSRMIFVQAPKVAIQQVEKGSPADQAGLKLGDFIVSVNGESMKGSSEVVARVREAGTTEIVIGIEREGNVISLPVTPATLKENDAAPRLGVLLADAAIIRYPWYIAIYKGFIAAGVGLINTFTGFFILIKNLILGKGLAFEIAGPVGIASLVGQSARLGVSYLLNVTAMISLSLAAINIMPIPALDGGRVLFILVEKVIRKPVPMKYEQMAHTIGFLLLMVLVVIVTGRDILGLIK